MQQNQNLFCREKPALIILSLNKPGQKYALNISKECNTTYSHTVNILKKFKCANLVEFKKEGRIKHITLTEKGKTVAQAIENIYESLKN